MTDPTPAEQISVQDAPERGRFEIVVDGVTAGFTEYSDDAGLRTFPHTLVDDAFQGRGLASRLIRAALDATRAAGLQVLPVCPAVQRYIAKHPDYLDLVPPERRAEANLA